MEACYGGTDVMERSCAVARGIDINKVLPPKLVLGAQASCGDVTSLYKNLVKKSKN